MQRSRGPSPPQRRRLAPERAPSEIEPLLVFLNTAERRYPYYQGHRVERDVLRSREDLEHWLAGQEIVPAGTELSGEEHRRTLALRDSLLTRVQTDSPAQPEALRHLRELGETVRLRVRFDDHASPDLEALGEGLEGALGRWLWLFVAAHLDGRWRFVKRCEGCLRIFYTTSTKTKYCTTRCGDRIRSRRRKTPRRRVPMRAKPRAKKSVPDEGRR